MKSFAIPSSLILTLVLSACGGGGSDSGTMAAAGQSSGSDMTLDSMSAQGLAVSGGDTDAAAQVPAVPGTDTTANAGTPPKSETPAAGTQKPANGALTTIDQVITDMHSDSEAMVIDPRYDWQHRPAITMYSPAGKYIPDWWTGNRPEWSYNVLTWFTAYEAQGNAASNSRIQIRNLRFFVLSENTRTWKQFDSRSAPAVDLWKYPFAPAGGNSGVRNESSGGISIKPKYPNFHHGYGNTVKIEPQDVRAVYVAMDFRLTLEDQNKPDDRDSARYVVDAGGDYWPGNGQGDWSLGYAPGMGNSRMLLATKDWRSSGLLVPNKAYGATFEELRKNPPPLN